MPAAVPEADAAAPVPAAPLWRVEKSWPSSRAVPPAVQMRLLSIAEKDKLQLASLEILPVVAGGAKAPAPDAEEQEAETGGGAGAALPAAVAVAGSQMDDVRSMLSRLAAQEGQGGSGGAGAAADPKRALIAAIAKRVLQQPTVVAGRHGQQPTGQQADVRLQQQQQAESLQPQQPAGEQQQVAAALGRLEERVGHLEVLCSEIHGMLLQLLAARDEKV